MYFYIYTVYVYIYASVMCIYIYRDISLRITHMMDAGASLRILQSEVLFDSFRRAVLCNAGIVAGTTAGVALRYGVDSRLEECLGTA